MDRHFEYFFGGFTNLPTEKKIEIIEDALVKARADAAVMMGGCGYGKNLFQRHIAELEDMRRKLSKSTDTSVPNSPELLKFRLLSIS